MKAALYDPSKYYTCLELYFDYEEIQTIVKILESAYFRGYSDFEKKTYDDIVRIFNEELSTYEN